MRIVRLYMNPNHPEHEGVREEVETARGLAISYIGEHGGSVDAETLMSHMEESGVEMQIAKLSIWSACDGGEIVFSGTKEVSLWRR